MTVNKMSAGVKKLQKDAQKEMQKMQDEAKKAVQKIEAELKKAASKVKDFVKKNPGESAAIAAGAGAAIGAALVALLKRGKGKKK